jgi:fermentation-respiration switch protein FrsA (DUF1100 family)
MRRLFLTPVLFVLALLCSGCATKLFYFPDVRVRQTPQAYGCRFENITFRSQDRTILQGWFLPAKTEAKGTVIHFHGNAQNITAHVGYVAWLVDEGFNVLTFDYRGYGFSQGEPNPKGVYEDCLAAIEYAKNRSDVDAEKLILFGQSLGAANAIAVAGKAKIPGIRAVVAESSFYSYRAIARRAMEQSSCLSFFRWPLSLTLVNNSYSASKYVGDVSPVPLLLIHGIKDRVVPYTHSEKLFAKAKEPKDIWVLQKGGHTEALIKGGAKLREALVTFFEDALGEYDEE